MRVVFETNDLLTIISIICLLLLTLTRQGRRGRQIEGSHTGHPRRRNRSQGGVIRVERGILGELKEKLRRL